MLDDGGQRLRGVAGIADDIEIFVCAAQYAKRRAHHPVVIGEDDRVVLGAVGDGVGEQLDQSARDACLGTARHVSGQGR
jgi:hypothetical protein